MRRSNEFPSVQWNVYESTVWINPDQTEMNVVIVFTVVSSMHTNTHSAAPFTRRHTSTGIVVNVRLKIDSIRKGAGVRRRNGVHAPERCDWMPVLHEYTCDCCCWLWTLNGDTVNECVCVSACIACMWSVNFARAPSRRWLRRKRTECVYMRGSEQRRNEKRKATRERMFSRVWMRVCLATDVFVIVSIIQTQHSTDTLV